ncbi:MAG: flagellar biosynthesis protein [Paucibacter sp.]|nr:flagellar biosynthesis protein [Roseateles sp.]
MQSPRDQADGLRRIFKGSRLRVVPVVSNPHVPEAGVLVEALCAAFAEQSLHTLVVDAAEYAPEANELASVDLGAAIERLSKEVSYLAARGLPMRHLNTQGSAAGFLDALAEAAPHAEVLVLHASAAELARLIGQRELRPLLLAGLEPHSVTHAYAGMKWLTQRCGLMAYSLLLATHPQLQLAGRIAQRISSCGDSFLGALLRDWACFDPRTPVGAPLPAELRHLARELLNTTEHSGGLPTGDSGAPLRSLPPARYAFLAGAL